MRIKAVRLQNIRTFGNELTEIRMDGDMTLVIGLNGAGKSSSLLESVCFGLFGKPFNPKINKGQLVNTITRKGLLIEIDCEAAGKDLTIRRGIKPNLLEVIEHRDEGDVVVPAPGSVVEFQETIEKDFIRMSVHTFRQIVLLSARDSTPFMRLEAAKRREVTEDVLDIQVFSAMNKVLTERAKVLAKKREEVAKRLDTAQKILEVEERSLAARRKDVEATIAEMTVTRQRYVHAMTTAEAEAADLQAEVDALVPEARDIDVTETRLSQYEETRRKLDDKHRVVERSIQFYQDNEHCPSCTQAISKEFRAVKVEDKTATAKKLSGAFDEISVEVDRLTRRLSEQVEITRQLRDLTRRVTEANSQARTARTYAADIDAEIGRLRSRGNVEVNDAEVEKSRELVAGIGKERDDLDRQARVMGAAGQMLRDGGVKTAIIREYIPEMNRILNDNLSRMDLMVGFYLDENFNEIIRSRHRDDFTYEMFSAGEKLRIDLAILFTWREIARRRTGASINLLVLDEILDSSLDGPGTEDFLKLLKGLTSGQNVFIVSHKSEQLTDRFDRTLRFVKRNNFSQIEDIS